LVSHIGGFSVLHDDAGPTARHMLKKSSICLFLVWSIIAQLLILMQQKSVAHS